MYNLYFYDINNFSKEDYVSELALLPKLRQKKITAKANEIDRKLSLAGDMLIYKAITEQLKISRSKINIAYGEMGKPYAANLNIHFSVSHSGSFAAVAISDKPVGVDIEKLRPFSAAVANKIFTEKEKDYLMSVPCTEQSKSLHFFELWTIKEAYIKLHGTTIGHIKDLSLQGNNGMFTSDEPLQITMDYSVPDYVTAIVQEQTDSQTFPFRQLSF